MRYSLALFALAAAVQASPFPLPGGVTSAIAPKASAPPGCTGSHSTFGIAVMNVSTAAKHKRQVSTISDGQPQAPTSEAVVTTISDGQPQAPSATAVSEISDGQPQAPTACAASQISDGQPQVCTSTHIATMAPISQITDGQIQGGMHTMTMMPVSQIHDGQPQAPTMTWMPVSVISDGQPQAPVMPTMTECAVSQIVDGQPQKCTTATAVSEKSEGQPQAPTYTSAVSEKSEGQPQAPTYTSAVSQKSEGQPQAPTASTSAPTSTSTPYQLVACKTNSTLQMSLSNGILTDADGRTGYIAANYQFQFDKPPQAGAIYTAGFSICENGSLALGGSNIFYQCRSGSFYNLYNKNWASQCSPVTIESLMLVNC